MRGTWLQQYFELKANVLILTMGTMIILREGYKKDSPKNIDSYHPMIKIASKVDFLIAGL